MADLILGQPSNLTVVSNNGAGFVRVTYAPWELDWEFFDAIAIGNWLANTTTAVSVDITAKGGAEHLGYWFDLNQAFPSANWNTGDRITPQRQAAISQFATFAAAVAAMAVLDVFLVWYQSTTNKRVWLTGRIVFAGTAGSVWGMLSRRQIGIVNNSSVNNSVIHYSGNLLAQNQQVHVTNLVVATTNQMINVYYNPTAGQAGQGILVKRVETYGGRGASIYILVANAGTCAIYNCFGARCTVFIAIINNCGPIANCAGIHAQNYAFNLNSNVGLNCFAMEISTLGFANAANARFCADTDNSLPVAAGNLRNQNPRTQLRTFRDLASPGLKKFPEDLRFDQDSVMSLAGQAVVAVPRDCDGRLRPAPPSMGPFEYGTSAFVPAAEIIRPALRLLAVRA